MIRITEKKECCGCNACANICPQKCISTQEDSDGFLYPQIDEKLCVNCGLCDGVCPINNYTIPKRTPKAYGAINQNDNVRNASSSGGVFYLLCKYVIQNNGVVFGAAFDKEFNVFHTYSECLEDCRLFMGSKYVPSVIGDSYEQVKRFLNNNRIVLFTGTPCQIAGLYSFLGYKEYDNLITQDIICHSVPSPEKWNEFKKKISGGRQIVDICFRNKDTGWSTGSFVAKFYDGSEYKELYAETEYMKGFLKGEYSRPSCYECKFSRIERQSDITLGDFWGVEGLYSKLYDNKGTSVVLVNSQKGRKVFKKIKKELILKRVKLEYAIKYNPAATRGSGFVLND